MAGAGAALTWNYVAWTTGDHHLVAGGLERRWIIRVCPWRARQAERQGGCCATKLAAEGLLQARQAKRKARRKAKAKTREKERKGKAKAKRRGRTGTARWYFSLVCTGTRQRCKLCARTP